MKTLIKAAGRGFSTAMRFTLQLHRMLMSAFAVSHGVGRGHRREPKA